MSLITRCPACSTMFKVVPDQLRISEGWVRCGQCDEVFDANSYLQIRSAPEQTLVPIAASPEIPSLLASTVIDAQLSVPASGPTEVDLSVLAAEVMHSAAVEPALQTDGEGTTPELTTEPVATGNGLDLLDMPAPADRQVKPEEIFVSFMTADPKSTVSMRRGMTLLWGFLAGVSFLALAAQVVWQERDRIAATEPASIPLLTSLCEVTGCSIVPLRQIESVVIDSSAFTKMRPDLYQLSFVLKNTAMVEVATPALELTLTDMRDQALVRRVFTAAELGAQKPVLAAGGEWASSMPVDVQLPGAAPRISGYRLLAFYP